MLIRHDADEPEVVFLFAGVFLEFLRSTLNDAAVNILAPEAFGSNLIVPP